jgi:hypothetical protein
LTAVPGHPGKFYRCTSAYKLSVDECLDHLIFDNQLKTCIDADYQNQHIKIKEDINDEVEADEEEIEEEVEEDLDENLEEKDIAEDEEEELDDEDSEENSEEHNENVESEEKEKIVEAENFDNVTNQISLSKENEIGGNKSIESLKNEGEQLEHERPESSDYRSKEETKNESELGYINEYEHKEDESAEKKYEASSSSYQQVSEASTEDDQTQNKLSSDERTNY